MKNILLRGWQKIRLAVIIILSIGIGIIWTLDYQMFSEIKREADWAYSEAMKIRQSNNGIGEPAADTKDSETKAETFVPTSEDAEHYDSARGGDQKSLAPIHEVLPKIYQLESSSGKNDSCKQKGLVNGYGYAQSTFSWRCYNTKEEVEKEVASWFDHNLKTYTLAQAVCRYNTGTPSETCPYWEKYQSLN